MVNVNGEPIFISTDYGEDEGEGGNSLGYIKDGRVEIENTKHKTSDRFYEGYIHEKQPDEKQPCIEVVFKYTDQFALILDYIEGSKQGVAVV